MRPIWVLIQAQKSALLDPLKPAVRALDSVGLILAGPDYAGYYFKTLNDSQGTTRRFGLIR